MNRIILLLLVMVACSCRTYRDLPTSELKLRYRQCLEVLSAPPPKWEFKFGGSPFDRPLGQDRKDALVDKNRYESELLKRYKAGDKEARLPFFE